ncbi:M48 family metallopeptidase [Pontibacter sp. SGAir0037]|uniref:M48 family metallopeptidase n=1 Tax=Pontibacter sp. SGAir0037 TaxID=2571030 RepID=UPI0010CCBD60|nr:SprT family zinc-dependent metalloprotease [Pontibacter sp. SGAir0037]QCR25127.1 M48 family peptidase [Pontibacter sp. SGAir0037]
MSSQFLRLTSVNLHIEGIGKVLIERSDKAKRVSISVRPLKGIRVAVPPGISFEKAEQFIYTKADWIKEHQARMQQHEEKVTTYHPDQEFKTRYHTLRLLTHAQYNMRCVIQDGYINVFYPAFKDVQDNDVQKFIRKSIEETYRREAKQYLPQRVEYFAKKFGFQYQNVFIKNAKSRWGSCSYTNNINLNLHLMRLPEALCDYVILHELAHTIEKNHGPGFWALLEKVCVNSKVLDQKLKAFRISIY